jgi:hypothetical protein
MFRSWMHRLFFRKRVHPPRKRPVPLAVESLEERQTPAVVPLSQTFLSQAYSDLLNRPIDATGLAAWSTYLATNSRVSAVMQIETSQEFRGLEVDQLYASLLHRAAEPGGRQFWIDFLAQGQPAQVAADMAGSSEYFALAGSTNTGFINALYRDALGRQPDPQGWVAIQRALAAGIDRTTIAEGVFTSPEYLNNLVAGYYSQYLHRSPDPGGQAVWVGLLEHGTSQAAAIAGFVGSVEYYAALAQSITGPAALQVSDLTYLGSQFLPTTINDGGNAYGALAERVHPDGSKTYFILGHGGGVGGQNIWEIASNGFGLDPTTAPRASLVQNWGMTLYGNCRVTSDPAHTDSEGLYWDAPTSRLYIMFALSYDVAGGPQPVLMYAQFDPVTGAYVGSFGPWKVDAGQQMARNYMTAIPEWFQPLVNGRRLAIGAGLESGSAGGSWGPCLLAIDEPGPTTPTSTVLTTMPLVEYPELLNGSTYYRARRDPNYQEVNATTGLPDWTPNPLQFPVPLNGVGYWCGTDQIRSCAWIDNGVVSGPVFGGMLGEQYVWYGEPVLPTGITAASGNAKGQNASQYTSYCTIYNPADLKKVTLGVSPAYGIDPSASFNVQTNFGAPVNALQVPTGMVFDADTSTLLMIFNAVDKNAGAATPGCVLEAYHVRSA